MGDPLSEAIMDRLDDRSLVYVGTRLTDGASLRRVDQVSAFYGITGAEEVVGGRRALSLERVSGRRVDLDAYDIDLDGGPEVRVLREELLELTTAPTAIVEYVSTPLVERLARARPGTVTVLGQFHEQQRVFGNKPWVERNLAARGIRTIPWRHIAVEEVEQVRLDGGQVVIRPDRSSGGRGLELVRSIDELRVVVQADPRTDTVAIAPFLAEAVPLNVGAVLYPDGGVSLHPASVQLIGTSGCTTRRFGFCGNDFAAVRSLSTRMLGEVDAVTRSVAAWLHRSGFAGAFGVDYLCSGDDLLLTEVNSRLQGSTDLSSRAAEMLGRPGIVLEHLAARLGVPSPSQGPGVAEWAEVMPAMAQILVHNLSSEPCVAAPCEPPPSVRVEHLARPGTIVDTHAVVARIVADRAVTADLSTLVAGARSAVRAVQASCIQCS